jgi:hypothetical protein
MHDLQDKIKRYGPFTHEEWKAVIISILILTFIIGFNDGRKSFNLFLWIHNLLGSFIIVSVSFLIHQLGHRIAGLHEGFRVEYKLWWYGITLGLIFVFVSKGRLWFLAPGGIFIHHIPIHRLGKFRYGPNVFAFSMISLMGPLFSIFFATIFKTLDLWFRLGWTAYPFFNKFVIFNWLLAAYALLPIPPLAGSRMFFHSRLVYSFVFGCVAGYALLVVLFGIYSYIGAILIGTFMWLMYYILFERGAWKYV